MITACASRIPVERSIYAVRNVDALWQAEHTGAAIGRYAAALLDSPLPWTRMRRSMRCSALKGA